MLTRRREALHEPRMAPLRAFAARIRADHGTAPDFDPADGGPAARVLLLLETPGPANWRTGFVSMDNATGTSANLRRFLAQAGLHRSELVIWNTVPWVIHRGGPNRPPTRAEIADGLNELPALLPLLPELRGVVLCGRVAAAAGPVLEQAAPGLPTIRVPHPSPTFVCTHPEIGPRIVAGFELAAKLAVAFEAQPADVEGPKSPLPRERVG